ncbi:MAG: hypothetical protein P8O70_06255 [SAR324 cluster bacterium]|nr:hypothetical protein [SAR324 cluster bacterium]
MLSTINENKLRSVLHLAPENNVIVACRNLEAGEILELEGAQKDFAP